MTLQISTAKLCFRRDLFQVAEYFDDIMDEARTRNKCDLAAMHAIRPFLNQFSANADLNDAYVQD